ncbi:MAG: M1 family metallopeptidase [Bacteroidota bacterium]
MVEVLKMRHWLNSWIMALCWIVGLQAQTPTYDSGGILMPEQAAFDVHFYELSLAIKPEEKSIEGVLLMEAEIIHPTAQIVLNLDSLLDIRQIEEVQSSDQKMALTYHRQSGLIYIQLNQTRQAGEAIQLSIAYGGRPRRAPNAPWQGGFSWEKTPSGAHWIATTCQQEGADVWWPNKDHVSDKPDSMALHIRVPAPLVVATNGRLQSVEEHFNQDRTYHWLISTPISNYNVALNIAPYRLIETEHTGVSGEHYPVQFYVLPEDFEKGEKLLPEILDHLAFFEDLLGPYPFRKDKYGVAQTPHLGMEHQSIIAYGAGFDNARMTGRDWGFDALHHHELSHEWWGNLVTNFDWRDMWIHEGFGTYMQALYVERLSGKGRYRDYMTGMRRFANLNAVAPRATKTAKEIYRAPIYNKGAWILHTLRFVMGDQAFFKTLRLMAYPDPQLEEINDGRHIRFATTDDFLYLAEQSGGIELDWFFELYLRQAKVPVLHFTRTETSLELRWESPNHLPCPLPLEISINRQVKRYDIPTEGLSIPMEKEAEFLIDPNHWVLKELQRE